MGLISVPSITQRIPQEAIEDVGRQIVQKFRPHAIILFGSDAYGSPHPESDLGLLVPILPSLWGRGAAGESSGGRTSPSAVFAGAGVRAPIYF